jgi:hypothetical protein
MSIKTPAGPGPRPADPPHFGDGPGVVQVRMHRSHQDGGTHRAIATVVDLPPAIEQDLGLGSRKPTRDPAAAALAPNADAMPGTHLDAGGIRLRLRALHVMGHSSARIARAAGFHPTTIRSLVRGDTTTISPQLHRAIIAVYEAWWDKRPPERTRYERGAATAARKRAIAGNWCAAAALDDDQLDIPGYQPQYGWKPAVGTGTAPDICPPARRADCRP